MCDTLAALPNATAAGVAIFGKNSDRLRDEAQAVEIHPAHTYEAGISLACTYISIPQARRTHRLLIGRPYWMWGAEMGVNEHGVAIGNEAVFARTPPPSEPALLGMDLVRLGLERSASASEAVDVITGLLAIHGQGGNCARPGPQFYQNSFLVTDHREAFVVETLDRDWLVQPVAAAAAISNVYSIERPHAVSEGLHHLREERQACDRLGDPTESESGKLRRGRATARLAALSGRLTAADVFGILRDHGSAEENEPTWRPAGPRKPRICAHATDEQPRGQTVGSLVSEIGAEHCLHWVTAGSSPCVSVFKPVLLDEPLPSLGPPPRAEPNAASFWWRHDALHRALLQSCPETLSAFRRERDALEDEFQMRMQGVVSDENRAARSAEVRRCWRDALALEDAWAERLCARAPAD